MTLSEWAKRHAGVSVVAPGDPRVADFFRATGIASGGWGVELHRFPDLPEFFRRHGGTAFFLLMEEASGAPGAISSVVVRTCTRAKEIRIGVIGDGRIAPEASRRTRGRMRDVYRDLVDSAGEIDEFREVNAFYTSIFAANRESLLAFARGRRGLHYAPVGEIHSLVRLVIPGISGFLWNLDRPLADYRVEFSRFKRGESPEFPPGAADAEPLRDAFAPYRADGYEKVTVRRTDGTPIASAVWWRDPVRSVEFRKIPGLWRGVFGVLRMPRRVPLRWLSFPAFVEGVDASERSRVIRAVLLEARRTGRLRSLELIANPYGGEPRISGLREGFPQRVLSNLYRVSGARSPLSPASGGPIALDPAFL